MLLAWKKLWSWYGKPSSSQITSDGSGSLSASTRSTGLGPASIRSIRSSVIRWTAGRMASMRLTVNEPMTIRRMRAWSGSSMLRKDGGFLAAVSRKASFRYGKPGRVVSTLRRGSPYRARWSS